MLRIFTLAFALRSGLVLTLAALWGPEVFLIEDSGSYLRAAGESPRQPDVMPLYLLFLALLDSNPLWVALGQSLVDSLTCVVIACAAATLSPRLGQAAGTVAAFNPTQLVMVTLVLTETLFLFFSALALWAALTWIQRPAWRPALALGMALGLGILTRAMLLPWALGVPLVLVACAAIANHLTWRALPQLSGAGAIALALVLPVAYGNESRFGGFGLSSQGGTHALYWLVPLVIETVDGTPHTESVRRLNERFSERISAETHPDRFSRSRAMTAAAFEVLTELGPLPLAKAWAYGVTINLGAPAIILATPVRILPRTGFFTTDGESKLNKMTNFLFRNDNKTYAWLLIGGTVITLALRVAQAWGLWRLLRAGDRVVLASTLLLLAWIGFVLAINGPIASAKYRSPAEPALVILLAAALRPRVR